MLVLAICIMMVYAVFINTVKVTYDKKHLLVASNFNWLNSYRRKKNGLSEPSSNLIRGCFHFVLMPVRNAQIHLFLPPASNG